MSPLRKLAGQTAIYGLSSIIGRFLNYLLVPLHTSIFVAEQYGIITEMYAYVAFLVVLLAYGMENAYFRFSAREEHQRERIYSTSIFSLITTSSLFIFLATVFSQPIADWLRYPDHTEYVIWFAIIVGLDAISTIPLARLREEDRATRFAVINLVNIGVNIGLNIFFVGYLMPAHLGHTDSFLVEIFGTPEWLLNNLYDHEVGVGYVFIANLIASIVKFILLTPTMLRAQFDINGAILRRMLRYSLPLLLAGLAGIVNETIDRIMLKRILFDEIGKEAALAQVGIYGACYKIAILISLFIQAFRYAAEPFFFAQEKEENPKGIYSRVMTYFIIVASSIFLGVMLFIDVIKHFLQKEEYWQGLHVVPILLFAYIFYGIFYNLSFWYKLTGKTEYGAYISGFGGLITITMNAILIPHYGYVGSAWATFTCFGAMVLVSYILGARNYPIPYDLRKIGLYLGVALALYGISMYLSIENRILQYVVHSIFFLGYLGMAYMIEKPGQEFGSTSE